LKLLLGIGTAEIEKCVLGLTGHLIERLKEEGYGLQTAKAPENRSGIVNFLVEDAAEKVKKLQEKGIIVSARMNGVRVSPHFYNNEEELERLIEEVKKL